MRFRSWLLQPSFPGGEDDCVTGDRSLLFERVRPAYSVLHETSCFGTVFFWRGGFLAFLNLMASDFDPDPSFFIEAIVAPVGEDGLPVPSPVLRSVVRSSGPPLIRRSRVDVGSFPRGTSSAISERLTDSCFVEAGIHSVWLPASLALSILRVHQREEVWYFQIADCVVSGHGHRYIFRHFILHPCIGWRISVGDGGLSSSDVSLRLGFVRLSSVACHRSSVLSLFDAVSSRGALVTRDWSYSLLVPLSRVVG